MDCKVTIIDSAKFRQCIYELFENEDSIIKQEDIKLADALTEGFLRGELAVLYDTSSQCLKWVSTEWVKDKGLEIESDTTVVSRIIEKRVGTGILSEKELSKWEEVFKEVLKEIGLTIKEFLLSSELEKEAVWEVFRKRIRNNSSNPKDG